MTSRTLTTRWVGCCALLIACWATATPVHAVVGVFTGGDPGEGLDLQGKFPYAVDIFGPGNLQVGDALFTTETVPGFTQNAAAAILNWANPNFGATTNDNSLEVVMQSIRHGSPGGQYQISLGNLTPGRDYKVQLLFTESCCNRAMDVYVNSLLSQQSKGQLVANDFNIQVTQGGINGNPTNGAVVTHSFSASGTTAYITLDGPGAGGPGIDTNPTLSALTLEDLDTNYSFPVNIALGKPVIAGSSAYNGQPFNQPQPGVGNFASTLVTDGSERDVFGTNYWLGSQGQNNEFFVLDLGGLYNIDEIHLVNTHNDPHGDSGTQDFRIFASTEVDGLNALVDGELILQGALSDTAGQSVITPDVFNAGNGLTVAHPVRFLRFDALNFRAGDVRVGLNEILVFGTPIPEPATLALLALGGLATLRRRRRAA